MRIRPANPADLPRIVALDIRARRDVYRDLLPESYLQSGIEADLAAKWSRLDMRDINLVAETEQDAQMVCAGFATVQVNHPDGPYLDSFQIAPEMRADGRAPGVEHGLFNMLKVQLQVKRLSGLWLTVMEEDRAARRFYTMLGGKEAPPLLEEFCGVRLGFRKVDFPHL